jgi:hypothetical protein
MCTVFSLAETPQLPPSIPPHLSPYTRSLLVSHERRHLCVPPAGEGGVTPLPLTSTLSWQSKRQWVLFLEGQNCSKYIGVRSTVAATLKRVSNNWVHVEVVSIQTSFKILFTSQHDGMSSLSFSSVSQLIRGYLIYITIVLWVSSPIPLYFCSSTPIKMLVTSFWLVSYFFISWYEVFFQGKDAFV